MARRVVLVAVVVLLGVQAGPASGATYARSANIALIPDDGGSSSGGTLPTSGTVTGADGDSFDGFTFTSVDPSTLAPGSLSGYDTAVLNQVNTADLSDTAKQVLSDFVTGGGKLIIHDADGTTGNDYSWLPVPAATGQSCHDCGNSGGTTQVLENNSLVSSDPASPSYVAVDELPAGTDAVGDANVMVTQDPRWFQDITATNGLGQTGAVHTYASDNGLIVYNGYDTDNIGQSEASGVDWLAKLWYLELAQPWNPDGLPHGTPVVSPPPSRPVKVTAPSGPVKVTFPETEIPWTFGSTNGFPGSSEAHQIDKIPNGTFPLTAYVQPVVGLDGSAPAALSLSFSPTVPAALRIAAPSGAAWQLSSAGLGLTGPGGATAALRLAWAPSLKPFPDGAIPGYDAGRLTFTLAHVNAAEASAALAYPEGTASLTAHLGLNVKLGASLKRVAFWAAPRVLLALGAGALTDGAGAAAVEVVTQAEADTELAARLTKLVGTVSHIYGWVTGTGALVQLGHQSWSAVAGQAWPAVRAQIRNLLGAVLRPISGAVSAIARRLSAGPRWVFGFLAHDAAAAGAAPVRPLSVRPLTVRLARRLHRARLTRGSARTLASLAAPGASGSLTVRELLIAGHGAGPVAVLAGHLPDHGVAELMLAGPGYRAQRLVRTVGHSAGGLVALPRHRRRGRWVVAIVTEHLERGSLRTDLAVAPLR